MIASLTRPEAKREADRGEDNTSSFLAEQVAIHYIDEQLAKARRSLRQTRTFCLITVFLILGYMSFVTIAIRNRLLRPEVAAEMAAYYFSRFAAQNSPAPSASAGEQLRESSTPTYGSSVTKSGGNPDRSLTELNPSANADPLKMEGQVATYVHEFISQPHGNLQDMIREARHPKTVQQLSDELDQEIRERLPSRVREGSPDPDYMSYMDQKLATLEELEAQFDRLAHANDLTPYEKALRHIIASTMGSRAHLGS
jgi:hypothetical protein